MSIETARPTAASLIVVDCDVASAAVLLDGLPADSDVLQLSGGGGGLAQIAGYLQGRRGLSGLHIVGRGAPGALHLSGERIDRAALWAAEGDLTWIADALAEDALVVLYGGSVAAGPQGAQFLDHLERVLGVAVAASAGPVGSASRGGAWELRTLTGASVAPVFAPRARLAYPELLSG